ncbi:thermonuclease family protein [Pelagibacteraceae bacterium]|nr:thermonuclease family protein [Pelagibacteraceae bacterium]
MKYIIIFLMLISSTQAEVVLRQQDGKYCYDGDTCYVSVKYKDWPEVKFEKMRLLDIDTPEISRPKCKEEKELGLKARDFLNNLISASEIIRIETNYDRGRFGRILGHLKLDSIDASEALIQNGLGKIYIKGQKIDWCS